MLFLVLGFYALCALPLSRIAPDLEHAVICRRGGASTITQQLVKNLFLTTHRSFLRKGIGWGLGVYGAEAAARFYCRVPGDPRQPDAEDGLVSYVPATCVEKWT